MSLAPDVRVVGASEVFPNDFTPSVEQGTSFGGATVGAARPRRTFTVTNTGDGRLELGPVAVLASPRTGLFRTDVFYFGNLAGSTGAPGPVVNGLDLAAVRTNLRTRSSITARLAAVQWHLRRFALRGAPARAVRRGRPCCQIAMRG